MLEIKQKNVRSLKRHLPDNLKDQELVFLIDSKDFADNTLRKIGFNIPLKVGDTVLPVVTGSTTRYNANGKGLKLKDEPMETKYRDFQFTRLEYHGRDTVEVTSIVWVPYKRYKQNILPPPSIELTLLVNEAGQKLIATPSINYNSKNEAIVIHSINLLLEIFGKCIVLVVENGNFLPINRKKLNWELLPKGEYPWETIKSHILKKKNNQPARTYAGAISRFESIHSLNPDFHAIGSGGYKGYVVFGFNDLNIYILESQYHNNATYVFGQGWKYLTQFSKAEILFGNMHTKRLVHNKTWFKELSTFINSLKRDSK